MEEEMLIVFQMVTLVIGIIEMMEEELIVLLLELLVILVIKMMEEQIKIVFLKQTLAFMDTKMMVEEMYV